MGQAAVTKERLEVVTRQLAEAASRGELGTLSGAAIESVPTTRGGGMLQLVVTPETLLKLTSSGTKELVITINERA